MAENDGETKDGQGDEALEKLAGKLADAAGKNDVSALQTIVRDFYRDAVDLRTKNRELNSQLRDIQKKLPKDGEIVLTGADAKAWADLQKLGTPIGEINQKLTEGTAAQQKLSVVERDQLSDSVAEMMGWNKKGLRGVVRLENLRLDVKEVPDPSGARDAEGKVKKVKQAFVVPEGENAEPVGLEQYADEHLGDFRDVLAGSEADRNGRREPPTAPRIIRQKAGENGAGKGVTDEQLEQQVRQRHHFAV